MNEHYSLALQAHSLLFPDNYKNLGIIIIHYPYYLTYSLEIVCNADRIT